MSGRAFPTVRDQYELHLRECRDCRRVHRVLLSVYEDPFDVPTGLRGVRADKEFAAIMQRVRREEPEPWYERLWVRGGVVGLSASAAALALALMGVSPMESGADGARAIASRTAPAPEATPFADTGGIDHPAQSFARVVGGSADIVLPDDLPNNGNTLPVGTSFDLELDQTLQVALAGKVVANFTQGTELEWIEASPKLIEVRLDRGLIAMRYDRRPADPVLQVRTPGAVVRVIGTVFTVQVDSDQNTTVSVLRGEVEVVDPTDHRVVADVEAGYRFDLSSASYGDVSKVEVAAALPLSNDAGAEAANLANGQIPANWVVPGLPANGDARVLSSVPSYNDLVVDATPLSPRPRRERQATEDDGEDLIEHLMEDAARSRRAEVRAMLNRCRDLYDDPDERYRAALCISTFLKRHGENPLAVEGYLLVGMLRMDYALDYAAADTAIQEFLRRAPRHRKAELAVFRLWLSATEDGRISDALERGRTYLERYPNGRYVGKILQRFPELKSAL